MTGTSPDMEQRYRAMLLWRTGEARLMMGCAMRDTARAFVEASLRDQMILRPHQLRSAKACSCASTVMNSTSRHAGGFSPASNKPAGRLLPKDGPI